MIQPHAFDPVLAPIAATARREADTLLDLRECALSRTRPGRCVACYFSLQSAVAAQATTLLAPLRHWLETHIEVIAHDQTACPLESLPLHLDGDDLESYCRGVMAEFHDNRAYAADTIRLSFRYKQPAAPLAAA